MRFLLIYPGILIPLVQVIELMIVHNLALA